MRCKEEKELGVNNQGITQPLEVVQRPQFVGSRYTKGECSKVSDSSKTSSKSSRKENDGNNPHHPIEVSMARKELRQALIAILALDTERKGIISFNIQMFISMIIMFLMMSVKYGIEKHVPFVDYKMLEKNGNTQKDEA